METINLAVITQELPPEIARLLPETATVYDDGGQSAARVLCRRLPGGNWEDGILQVSADFADLPAAAQHMMLLHELAHLLTAGTSGPSTSQPGDLEKANWHDRYWLQIYALLAARCGLDIRDFPVEVDYIKSFDLTGADIDAAMAEAGGCWPKINDNVFLSRIVEIVNERADAARAGWRRRANLGWAVLAGTVAAVAGAGALVITLGAR